MNFEQSGCAAGGRRMVEDVEIWLEFAQREIHAGILIYIGS